MAPSQTSGLQTRGQCVLKSACRCHLQPYDFQGRLSFSVDTVPEAFNLLQGCKASFWQTISCSIRFSSATLSSGSQDRASVTQKLFVRACLPERQCLSEYRVPEGIVAFECEFPHFVWFTMMDTIKEYLPKIWHALTCTEHCKTSRNVLAWFDVSTLPGHRAYKKTGGVAYRLLLKDSRFFMLDAMIEYCIKGSICLVPTHLLTMGSGPNRAAPVPSESALSLCGNSSSIINTRQLSFYDFLRISGLTEPSICTHCNRMIWLCWKMDEAAGRCRLCIYEENLVTGQCPSSTAAPTEATSSSSLRQEDTSKVWEVCPVESDRAVILVEQEPIMQAGEDDWVGPAIEVVGSLCSISSVAGVNCSKLLSSTYSSVSGDEVDSRRVKRSSRLVKLAPFETSDLIREKPPHSILGVRASACSIINSTDFLAPRLTNSALLPGEALATAFASDSFLKDTRSASIGNCEVTRPPCSSKHPYLGADEIDSAGAQAAGLEKTVSSLSVVDEPFEDFTTHTLDLAPPNIFPPSGDDPSRSLVAEALTTHLHTKSPGSTAREPAVAIADLSLPARSETSNEKRPSEDSTTQYAKTRMCAQFRLGQCRRGAENCKFAHSLLELRATDDVYKTKMCAFWLVGHCKAGAACRHAHGEDELRDRVSAGLGTEQAHKWRISRRRLSKGSGSNPNGSPHLEAKPLADLFGDERSAAAVTTLKGLKSHVISPPAVNVSLSFFEGLSSSFEDTTALSNAYYMGDDKLVAEGLSQKHGTHTGLVVWGLPLNSRQTQLVWLNVSSNTCGR